MAPPSSRPCRKVVPIPSEFIRVYFFLDDRRREWWRATVEHVHVLSGRGDILVTATVMYEEAHGYQQMRREVEFLHNGDLRTDVDEEGNCGRAMWDCDDGERDLLAAEDMEDFQVSKRASSKDCVQRLEQRRGTRKSRPGETEVISQEEGGKIREAHTDLMRRVAATEAQLSSTRTCRHLEVLEERVNSVRVRAKVDLVTQLQRPLRRAKIGHGRAVFDTVLQCSEAVVQYPCDFKLFQYVARHVLNDFSALSEAGEVMFSPSITDKEQPSQHIKQTCILFSTPAAMMSWLGIPSDADRR